jgi:hypothetical protein
VPGSRRDARRGRRWHTARAVPPLRSAATGCPEGSCSRQPFHIRASAASDSRSRPCSSRRRLAHAGSSFRPRRPSRSRVTRWRTAVTALFASMIRWKWSTAVSRSPQFLPRSFRGPRLGCTRPSTTLVPCHRHRHRFGRRPRGRRSTFERHTAARCSLHVSSPCDGPSATRPRHCRLPRREPSRQGGVPLRRSVGSRSATVDGQARAQVQLWRRRSSSARSRSSIRRGAISVDLCSEHTNARTSSSIMIRPARLGSALHSKASDTVRVLTMQPGVVSGANSSSMRFLPTRSDGPRWKRGAGKRG